MLARFPGANEKVPLAAFSKQAGGNTGTALAAAARLGARTAYLGKLGRDEYSLFLLDQFEKAGVDFKHILWSDFAQPHVSFIQVEQGTGERRISRYWQPFELQSAELNRKAIEGSRVLFLDHYHTAAGLAAASWSKAHNGKVVVDAERMTSGLPEVLRLADYIIASEAFALTQTNASNMKEAAQILQERYDGVVVVTAGKAGAHCQTATEYFFQEAFAVTVLDTTGAGDVFHGAFMTGLLASWPVQKAVEFAAAAAALKCRALGGQAGIPGKQELLAFLSAKGKPRFWT